jgi:CHAD domain
MKAKRVKKLDPSATLAENAARIVLVRLDELRSLAARAVKPDESRAQHDMRIAAKRVRYILEVTEFCFGRAATEARRRARELQDVLGELNDCEVMLPQVERHVARLRAADAEAVRTRAGHAPDLDPQLAARAPNRTAYRGLEVLGVYIEARRGTLHARFSEVWSEQERAGIWDRLERVAEKVLDRERERRRAAERAERLRMELERAEREERAAAERASKAAAELAEARSAAGQTPSPRRDGDGGKTMAQDAHTNGGVMSPPTHPAGTGAT